MLRDLLYGVNVVSIIGATDIAIKYLCIDSRKKVEQSCFVAIRGTVSDGHTYIESAIENGAIAIICEDLPETFLEKITYVQVKNSAIAAGILANNFYDSPSSKVKLVGVTGTNGKTTVATILHQLFTGMGYKCGLIGTVQNIIGKSIVTATHTTPDSINLNALLHKMVEENCSHIFMECSSHAIHQHRLAGLHFAGGIFTNISHDHLDYHKTFDEYIKVKKSWFDGLPKSAFAISNIEDKRGAIMLQNTNAKKQYCSLKVITDFKGKILENGLQGLHMIVDEVEVFFKMIGEFNAYNLLLAYATAVNLGIKNMDVLTHLSVVVGAQGRFEHYVSRREKIIGIVDFAHSPDALLNVISTIKKLRQGYEKIITVIGCGGDRDKLKRPIMAQIACEHSDKAFFTSDNPRSENPQEIIAEMEAGVGFAAKKKYISILDRTEAIKAAVSFAVKDDIILIAGKGHEKYQEINGEKKHFDDVEVLKEMFDLFEK